MRILLDEDDFDKLTSGQIVRQGDAEIALSDIGYDRMIAMLEEKLNAISS